MWVFQQARCWVLGVGCSVFGGCLGLNRKPKTKQLPSLWDGRWRELEQMHLDKTWDIETKSYDDILRQRLLWWDMRQRLRSDTIAAKWRAMSMGRSQKGVCRHLFTCSCLEHNQCALGAVGAGVELRPSMFWLWWERQRYFWTERFWRKGIQMNLLSMGKVKRELRLQQRVCCLYLNLDICLYQYSSW